MTKSVRLFLLIALLLSAMAVSAQDTVIDSSNAGNLQEVLRLGRGSTEKVAFSPDGSWVAVGGSVGVWLYEPAALDTESEPVLLIPDGVGDDDDVRGMSFSADGSVLAATTGNAIYLWDVAGQSLLTTVEQTSARFAAFSPDSSILAFNSSYGDFTFWDILGGAEVMVMEEAHNQNVTAGLFSDDGSVFVSGSGDGLIKVWDVAGGTELVVLEGHSREITDLDFSPDGSVLVSSSGDGTVRMWDLSDGSALGTFDDSGSSSTIKAVEFTPDGSMLVAGSDDRNLYFWDAASPPVEPVEEFAEGAKVETEGGSIRDLSISPDGSVVVTVGGSEIVQMWDMSGSKLTEAVGHTASIKGMDFSPDSEILAFGIDRDLWMFDTSEMMEINFNASMLDITGASGETKELIAYAPDNSYVIVSNGFGITLLDPVTGEVLREMEAGGLSSALVISPDSQLVAYIGSDGGAVFEAATGTLLFTINGHTEWGHHIAFSPDQTMLATGADDGTVRIWAVP